VLAIAVLSATIVGCKREKGAAVRTEALKPIEVPRAVLAYIGLKNPQTTIDDLLAVGRTFLPLPFDRQGLLDLLAQKAKLPREMITSIDITGTFWLVLLEEQQAGERDAGVLVFPLRSRKEFEAELSKKMDRTSSEGELVLYSPKAGAVGLQPVKLVIEDKLVIAPTSKKSLELALPFVRANLVSRPPAYDLSVHLMVQHLLQGPGKDLDQKMDRALERLRGIQVPGGKGSSPVDPAPLKSATEATLRGWVEMLKTTRDLMLTAEIDQQQVTLSLRADAKPDGVLHKVIARQKPGDPYGYKLLPASSWLVFSTLSNPQATAERRKTWGDAVQGLAKSAAVEYRERLQQALTAVGDSFFADATVALHKGASGSGLSMSVVSRTAGAEKAQAALEKLVSVAGDWLKAKIAEEGDAASKEVKLDKQPFSHKGATGTIFELTANLPPDKQQQLSKLFGEKLTFGWAMVGFHALFCAGKDTEKQLQRMAESAATGKGERSLVDNPGFSRARSAAPSRTGMLYVSLLDFARWFEGTGLEEAETIAAALKDVKVETAPSLDWGVNAARTQLDVSLHLPVEHFRAFKPIMDELMKKRSPWGGAGGMGGPKRTKWQEAEKQ
jgi:hypothetical protein